MVETFARKEKISSAIKRAVCVLFAALLFLCLAGCDIKVAQHEDYKSGFDGKKAEDTEVENGDDKADKDGQKNVKEGSSQKKEDKNKFAEAAELVKKKDYSALPKKFNSWWFKRNMDHLQSGAQEDFDIGKYNAVYVDKKAMEGKAVDKVIYLTFDCGYDNGYTNGILDVLKKHKAPATFFVTQTYIRDNKEIVKRMKEEGHTVGNHTITHPNLSEASVDKIVEEIVGCQQYMKEAVGYDMDAFFRPPKGEYSEYLLQVAKDLGYTTVFWSIAYLDYDVNNQPSVDHVIEHWGKYYHPGAIPLIHNVSSANAAALDTILTNLEKEGYRFGSLCDIKIE